MDIFNDKYGFVDLETSGIDNNCNFILEIGAIRIEKGILTGKFSTFVNDPEIKELPQVVEKLTGINYNEIKNAPYADEVINRFSEFSKDCIFISHNASFDLGFLNKQGFYKKEEEVIDIVKLAQSVLGEKIINYQILTIAEYFKIKINRRRAIDNAEAAAKIYFELLKEKNKRA